MTAAHSQGCVAIRNLAGFGSFASLGYAQTQNTWSLDMNNRYFQAYDLYEGKTHKGYDSINIYEYMINFELSHVLKNGWAFSLDVPIASNTIVSRVEHASGERHSTHAFGIGDIRFTVYKWLLNTNVPRKGIYKLALGLNCRQGIIERRIISMTTPTIKRQKTSHRSMWRSNWVMGAQELLPN